MRFRNNLILGLISDLFDYWFISFSVFFCWLGLVLGYFLVQAIGWEERTAYWTFSFIGFAIGIKYDIDEARSDAVELYRMLGYLLFSVFLMAGSVLLVLSMTKATD